MRTINYCCGYRSLRSWSDHPAERTCVERTYPRGLRSLAIGAVCPSLAFEALLRDAVVSCLTLQRRCTDAELQAGRTTEHTAARLLRRRHRACDGALMEAQLCRERVGAAGGGQQPVSWEVLCIGGLSAPREDLCWRHMATNMSYYHVAKVHRG